MHFDTSECRKEEITNYAYIITSFGFAFDTTFSHLFLIYFISEREKEKIEREKKFIRFFLMN